VINAERILATVDRQLDHRVTPEQIEGAFKEAVIPDLVELRDAFERAKPVVRALAEKLSR
jgi:hypothetical protein